VLPTVYFDNQQPLAANKIADVIVDRHLPVANPIPKDRLRIGLINA
jgi:hypothetical protein